MNSIIIIILLVCFEVLGLDYANASEGKKVTNYQRYHRSGYCNFYIWNFKTLIAHVHKHLVFPCHFMGIPPKECKLFRSRNILDFLRSSVIRNRRIILTFNAALTRTKFDINECLLAEIQRVGLSLSDIVEAMPQSSGSTDIAHGLPLNSPNLNSPKSELAES